MTIIILILLIKESYKIELKNNGRSYVKEMDRDDDYRGKITWQKKVSS